MNKVTADSLFEEARNKVPDPKNPKIGDTYEYNVIINGTKIMTTRIVIANVNQNIAWVYSNGDLKMISCFEYYIRSMKGIQPIIKENENV